jgi:hypothetical protein
MSPRLVLLLLAITVAVLATGSMLEDTATADEAAHIAAGLIKLQQGRLDFYSPQPPLLETLIAIPLALTGHRAPSIQENRPWLAGQALLYRSGYEPERILTLARLPVIAMFLALCFAVYAFVRRVTNEPWAGVAAFALTGFCPTLMAHGRLATVDMGVTLFAFLAATWFLQRREIPSGMATAAALASKVSSALLLPFFAIVTAIRVILSRADDEGSRRRRPLHFEILRSAQDDGRGPIPWRAAVAAILSFIAIYLLIARSLDPTLPFRAFVSEARAVPAFGSVYVLPQFLLGEFSPEGWRHYYLVAIAVKTPLPALALFVIAATRKRRFETVACAIFIALFLIVSAFASLNLGIRHVLPIFPFAYAATVIALHDASRRLRNVSIALVALHVVIGVAAYPSYIAYFNPLIGSHRNADRVLIDSNLDWGQDLKRLRFWADENGVEQLRIHYFGAGSVEHEFGPRGERWSVGKQVPLPRGYFALSRHFYRLSFDRTRSDVDYDAYLRQSNAKFVTSIGGSIDVYRVD